MSTICQAGGRFSRCHNEAGNTCQYCGRAFCTGHRYVEEGHEAVCSRPRCRTKFDDLVRHLAYKERARQRNAVGLCGSENCGPHPIFECSLCNAHFCARHVTERMYPVRDGFAVIERPMSVCSRCWERRKIWRR
jgi:hypothetical protein